MTRRLLLSYLAITVIVLAILEIPLAVFYGQREEERFTAAAESDAVVLASYYEDVLHLGDVPDLQLASDYAERTGARVVLVDTGGISVFDTESDQTRDFSTRPEIITALTGVRSSGVRHSSTLDADLRYFAVPVASGGTVHGALRLTLDAHEVTERIQRFWLGLIAMAFVVLVAVSGVGWAVARSVTRPIRQLQEIAQRFANGDLERGNIDDDAPPEVDALGEAMNLMATRLDRLIESQRTFVSDASHQLRTPLTALRLRLENLEAELGEGASVAETSAAIDEIERLSTLVDDLLHLARAEEHPERATVNASDVVAERIDTWNAVAAEHEIELDLSVPSAPAEVLAIPGAVEQLLDNAIDNALRAGPAGSTIEVRIERNRETVEISVSDHGPGLSNDDKQRALERFWRGDTRKPGTGLGLAIAKSLTDASGGILRLTDTPGGGLTVVFELQAVGASSTMSG